MDARNYNAIETLLNGQIVTVRAIRPEGKKPFVEEFPELDQHSLYLRFFETKNAISDKELKYFTRLTSSIMWLLWLSSILAAKPKL